MQSSFGRDTFNNKFNFNKFLLLNSWRLYTRCLRNKCRHIARTKATRTHRNANEEWWFMAWTSSIKWKSLILMKWTLSKRIPIQFVSTKQLKSLRNAGFTVQNISHFVFILDGLLKHSQREAPSSTLKSVSSMNHCCSKNLRSFNHAIKYFHLAGLID